MTDDFFYLKPYDDVLDHGGISESKWKSLENKELTPIVDLFGVSIVTDKNKFACVNKENLLTRKEFNAMKDEKIMANKCGGEKNREITDDTKIFSKNDIRRMLTKLVGDISDEVHIDFKDFAVVSKAIYRILESLESIKSV